MSWSFPIILPTIEINERVFNFHIAEYTEVQFCELRDSIRLWLWMKWSESHFEPTKTAELSRMYVAGFIMPIVKANSIPRKGTGVLQSFELMGLFQSWLNHKMPSSALSAVQCSIDHWKNQRNEWLSKNDAMFEFGHYNTIGRFQWTASNIVLIQTIRKLIYPPQVQFLRDQIKLVLQWIDTPNVRSEDKVESLAHTKFRGAAIPDYLEQAVELLQQIIAKEQRN